MRFGWSQSGSLPPAFPAAASKNYPLTAKTGWTHGLEDNSTFNPTSNTFLMPARGATASSKNSVGFVTKPISSTATSGKGENYFYTIEIAPPTNAVNPQTGPRMFPIIDDVTIYYMPNMTAQVIQESLVVYE